MPNKQGNSLVFFLGLVALVAVVVLGWFFLRRGSRPWIERPLPSPLVSATPVPSAAPSGSSGGQSLGAATISPVFGANIAGRKPDPAQVAASGIRATTYWFYRPQFAASASQAVSQMERIEGAKGNLTTYVHLMPQGQGGQFSLPSDLSTYMNEVSALVAALKDKVTNFSVSNEVPATWKGSLTDYQTLLSNSYQTIKKANPAAQVLDSGQSSGSLGIDIAYSMYQKGQTQQAVDFLNGYFRLHTGPQLKRFIPVSSANIAAVFADPSIANQPPFGRAMFKEFCPYYDVYQVHFYQEWSYLPVALEWIKSQMQANNCVKPIQIWELGYGVDNPGNYNVNDHAKAVPKYLTIAAAEGAQLVNYVTFYEKGGFARGLYTSSGGVQPPATAFQIAVSKLTGVTGVTSLGNGTDTWLYKFTKSGQDIYVGWAKNNRTVTLAGKSQVSVTDTAGKTTSANAATISLSDSPVFIE